MWLSKVAVAGVILLPEDGGSGIDGIAATPESGSLAALESSLTPGSLGAALGSLQKGAEQAELLLPKFSFKTRLELAPLLSQTGMPDLFDPAKADLSGMDGMKDLSVGAVVQQATVEVDESGRYTSELHCRQRTIRFSPSICGSPRSTPFCRLFIARIGSPARTGCMSSFEYATISAPSSESGRRSVRCIQVEDSVLGGRAKHGGVLNWVRASARRNPYQGTSTPTGSLHSFESFGMSARYRNWYGLPRVSPGTLFFGSGVCPRSVHVLPPSALICQW